MVRHNLLWEKAQLAWQPKSHMMVHVCLQIRFLGNPLCVTTYLDEDMNGKLAKIAKNTHRTTYSFGVLKKLLLLQRKEM